VLCVDGVTTASRSAPEDRRWLALILVVIFRAFLLRLWDLRRKASGMTKAGRSCSLQPLVQLDPNYPPFYTFWLGLWIQVAGDAVWTMRFWSLLVGVVTVALVARIARGWFGARAGLLAALFVAATPILWVYSQEIRSVIAMPLLAVALLAAVEAFLSHPKGEPISRRVWLWLPLIEIISLYTQNLGVPLVAWLNATVLAALAFRRDWPRLVRWLAVQVGLFVLYLPWLLTQRPTGTPLNTPPPLSLSLPWDIWQSYFTGIKAMLGANRLLMALTALFGAVGLLAVIVALLRWRSRPAWLAFSQLLLLPVFQYGIIRAANVDFHPRYFILAVPATLILMAAGLAAPTSPQPAVGAVHVRPSSVRPVLALSGAAVLSIAIMARMAWLTYSSWQFQHDDFRAIAAYYSEHATFWAQIAASPREKLENQRYYAVVVPYGWEPTLDYYRQKADIRLFFVGIPLHSNAETIVERLRSELGDIQEAELLTWYQLPADVRGAYPCLLGTNGEEHESRSLTINGIQSVNYAWMPGFRSIPAPDTVVAPLPTFGEVQLLDARNISGAFGACVLTRWMLPKKTGENWRISVPP
jgi:4-amino-4-deoxy-L-arabinose transferase-like glycosyltransferase